MLNVVQGIGEEVGAALVSDPQVRRISFTGSPEAARHIGAAAARNIVPFTAELGGKSPFIVFADADLDAAARKAAGQYDDAGQVCLAGTRLLVEASVRDAFLERMLACADEHVLGDSREPETTISPLIHPDHLARVRGFVERSRAAGDRMQRGGRIAREGGLWYEPTLIEPRSNESEIVQNEVFGPVLTLQTFSGEAQAVALANGTRYGLSGIVYTGDAARAGRIGRAVRAGTVWVNCFLIRDLTAPFDRVAGDVVAGLVPADVAAVPADDDGDLTFVVQPSAALGAHHPGAVPAQCADRLVEVGGGRGQPGHEFVHPARVVQVHADDLARLGGGKMDRILDGDRPSVLRMKPIAFTGHDGRITVEQDPPVLSHGTTPSSAVGDASPGTGWRFRATGSRSGPHRRPPLTWNKPVPRPSTG